MRAENRLDRSARFDFDADHVCIDARFFQRTPEKRVTGFRFPSCPRPPEMALRTKRLHTANVRCKVAPAEHRLPQQPLVVGDAGPKVGSGCVIQSKKQQAAGTPLERIVRLVLYRGQAPPCRRPHASSRSRETKSSAMSETPSHPGKAPRTAAAQEGYKSC